MKGRFLNLHIYLAVPVLLLSLGSNGYATPCKSIPDSQESSSEYCRDGSSGNDNGNSSPSNGNDESLSPAPFSVEPEGLLDYQDWGFLRKLVAAKAAENSVNIGIDSPAGAMPLGSRIFSTAATKSYQSVMDGIENGKNNRLIFPGNRLLSPIGSSAGAASGDGFSQLSALERASAPDVPESATLFLVGAGLIGLSGFSRKRTIKIKP